MGLQQVEARLQLLFLVDVGGLQGLQVSSGCLHAALRLSCRPLRCLALCSERCGLLCQACRLCLGPLQTIIIKPDLEYVKEFQCAVLPPDNKAISVRELTQWLYTLSTQLTGEFARLINMLSKRRLLPKAPDERSHISLVDANLYHITL